ncbi:ABC-type transport auxiliary lipoprotein family protein [Halomonas sp. PAMB 3232]|uniref:ABC-type transport auxiliary lipoprotein family protein n=1 Tax=Halomonas sp. PAMB 3232 TaxID=3075221 RepID=UPI0028987380|nr:ABC-type transport auxiliary lipoprotein family protein [Halomonas sp. PAMB 3232]WNL40441.1 ABC-type transport auxiliary lipoprotein family protein [Halomonas sp. PAMB 3232]
MKIRVGLGLFAAALLAGCSVLPKSDPATLYRLPVAASQPPANNPLLGDKRLGVAAPEAGHLFSGNRIVVYPDRNVVNVYEGARWHEDAPALIQTRLIDALSQSGLFEGVSVDRLPSDLLLVSELRHFQSEYDRTPPAARIQLDVQLVDGKRQPIANETLIASARAASVEIPDVVDAFGEASDRLSAALVEWLANLSSDALESERLN